MNNFSIYGLRLKWDPEVRYVGMTTQPLAKRLHQHLHMSGSCCGAMYHWRHENRDGIEIFEFTTAIGLRAARLAEKSTIALCLQLGCRLFNRAHVPHPLRFERFTTKLSEQPSGDQPPSFNSQTLAVSLFGVRQGRFLSQGRPAFFNHEFPHHT